MISVNEALAIIKQYQYVAAPKMLPLIDTLGDSVTEDIYAPIDMPPFRQSAMDGYAINTHQLNKYIILDEVKAGDTPSFHLKPGEAVRIFTGAAVPDSANAVIMQEKTTRSENDLYIDEVPKPEQNIRPQGEQIKKGTLALEKGTVLNPANISFLASLGISHIPLQAKPKVAIVITGSELIAPGTPYQDGKIYESNSVLLATTLIKEGILNYSIHKVADDYQSTEGLLQKVIIENDFVLVSGGISVGDYDFVGKALAALSTEELFYKIKQKPGKPLFFGKNNATYIFALPGNPSSALTCFYMYALPMLRAFSGHDQPHLAVVKKIISHDYSVKGIRAQFLKAFITQNTVRILEQQSSAMIYGFSKANALAFVPENTEQIRKDTSIDVILLP